MVLVDALRVYESRRSDLVIESLDLRTFYGDLICQYSDLSFIVDNFGLIGFDSFGGIF